MLQVIVPFMKMGFIHSKIPSVKWAPIQSSHKGSDVTEYEYIIQTE